MLVEQMLHTGMRSRLETGGVQACSRGVEYSEVRAGQGDPRETRLQQGIGDVQFLVGERELRECAFPAPVFGHSRIPSCSISRVSGRSWVHQRSYVSRSNTVGESIRSCANPISAGEVDDVAPGLPSRLFQHDSNVHIGFLMRIRARVRSEQPDVDHLFSEPIPYDLGEACECARNTLFHCGIP